MVHWMSSELYFVDATSKRTLLCTIQCDKMSLHVKIQSMKNAENIIKFIMLYYHYGCNITQAGD